MKRPTGPSVVLATILVVSLTAHPVRANGLVLSADTGGYYDGNEWSDLVRSVVTVVVLMIASDDEEGDTLEPFCDYGDWHNEWRDDDLCDELGFSMPQVYTSAALGYRVNRSMTVGFRYQYRHDRRDNDIARLWGGGPELTIDLGSGTGRARPFVIGHLLYTQGQARSQQIDLPKGVSVGVGAGVRYMISDVAGMVFQAGYQDDRFPDGPPYEATSRGATIGIGFRIDLQ